MEDWWENWFSDLDMNGENFFNQCQTNSSTNIKEPCRDDIRQQQQQQQATETQTHSSQYFSSSSHSSNVVCWGPSLKFEPLGHSSKENNLSCEARVIRSGTKRGRSSWETQDHIMSERKRRQEMAERFVALSAIIPGLKKIDKASVLREAINYVKQLKERIAVLEQEGKRKSATPIISIRKSQSHHPRSASRETTNSNAYLESNQVLPEVEAISIESENELLIRIHCEKRRGILLKLLTLLENMHLSIASSSVLPFGINTLNITIIAQMGEDYSVTMEELVKNLRQDLLKLYDDVQL